MGRRLIIFFRKVATKGNWGAMRLHPLVESSDLEQAIGVAVAFDAASELAGTDYDRSLSHSDAMPYVRDEKVTIQIVVRRASTTPVDV
jgi:hypothetical protein